MAAVIVPFPSVRRVGQIRRTATAMAKGDARWAEGHLKAQLTRLEGRLLKAGLPPDVIADEVLAYESAIRSHLWRLVLMPGDSA